MNWVLELLVCMESGDCLFIFWIYIIIIDGFMKIGDLWMVFEIVWDMKMVGFCLSVVIYNVIMYGFV